MPDIKLESSDFENICELIVSLPLSEVAKKYDCVPQSISRFLKANGVTRKQLVNANRKAIVIADHEAGISAEVTAAKLGVAVHRFYVIRKELLGCKFNYWKGVI